MDTRISAPRLPLRRRFIRWCILLIGGLLLVAGGDFWWTYHGPAAETEIYHGVFYSCETLPETDESGGLLHLIRADLNVPDVSLFVTPLNQEAIAHGWQYELRSVSAAVRQNDLAAAVNGTLYGSDSTFVRLSGDWARSSETVVADHIVSHVDPNSYLLWWDDAMIAHLEKTKPPSEPVLHQAKWAIAGQSPQILNGKFRSDDGRAPDKRTMIAADPFKRLVWMAVFDKASYRFADRTMVEHGAKLGVMVDGGTSIAMAIGKNARGAWSGTVTGNWRPVATQFGVRAKPW